MADLRDTPAAIKPCGSRAALSARSVLAGSVVDSAAAPGPVSPPPAALGMSSQYSLSALGSFPVQGTPGVELGLAAADAAPEMSTTSELAATRRTVFLSVGAMRAC